LSILLKLIPADVRGSGINLPKAELLRTAPTASLEFDMTFLQ